MRPLAVLILVLGAVASLIFAIISISSDSRGTPVQPDLVVRPAEVDLRDDGAPAPPPIELAESLAEITERTTVSSRDEDVPAETGTIVGTVVAADSTPVQGAEVSLMFRPGGPSMLSETIGLMNDEAPPLPKRKATTDKVGAFKFAGIEPGGSWTLVVTHASFAKVEVGPVVVPPNGVADELITLTSGLALFGTIRESLTGRPVEGAVVTIDSPLAAFLPSSRPSSARQEAISDAKGEYAFGNIGAGSRTLTVTAKSYATQVVSNFNNELRIKTNDTRQPQIWQTNRAKQLAAIEATPNEAVEWDFELIEGQVIAGTVLDPSRAGVAGVQINAFNQSGSAGSRGSTVSGANGEFLIEDLGEGVYTIHSEMVGYQSTPLQRVEAGRTDVEILLATQGSVAGRVIDAATGKVVNAFNLKVRALHPRNISWGGVVAKQAYRDRKDGSFALGGISEGEYVIEGLARGYASTFSETFRVDQGIQTRDVIVRLTKGGTVKGTVLDAYTRQPIVGAVVKTNDNNYVDSEIMLLLNSMGSSATSKQTTKTNEEGEFELTLLTPDTYQVKIEKSGYTPMILNDIKVGDGAATEIGPFSLRKGGVVTGIVYGPLEVPIAGANVVLRSTDNDYFGSTTGRSDANGRYVLRNAKAGSYSLSASRPPTANSNPFAPVVDIQHSEIEITIADGGTYDYDLHLPPRTQN